MDPRGAGPTYKENQLTEPYSALKNSISSRKQALADVVKNLLLMYSYLHVNLASFTVRVPSVGRDRSLSRALEVLGRGCDMESMGACNNAGLVYMNQKETAKAVSMFKKACSRDFKNACFNLSGIYIQGMGGVERDMKKAFEYASKSCAQGHPLACANVSRMYKLGEGVAKDMQLAEAYKRKALELNR